MRIPVTRLEILVLAGLGLIAAWAVNKRLANQVPEPNGLLPDRSLRIGYRPLYMVSLDDLDDTRSAS